MPYARYAPPGPCLYFGSCSHVTLSYTDLHTVPHGQPHPTLDALPTRTGCTRARECCAYDLLLNACAKVGVVARVDALVRSEGGIVVLSCSMAKQFPGKERAENPPFDPGTAIRVCRQVGFFGQATYLVKGWERNGDYLRGRHGRYRCWKWRCEGDRESGEGKDREQIQGSS